MAFRWVVDARGVDRRVYNLRARWRSARARRDFPRPLYRAICRTATGREGDAEAAEGSDASGSLHAQRSHRAVGVAFGVLSALGFSTLVARIGGRPNTFMEIAVPFVALAVGLAYLLASRLPWISRSYTIASLLTSPLEWVDDGQMAAAIVVNGRCPSCAYPVDPSRPEGDGAVVCAECGGAWVVVRRGGALRLGR